MLPFLKTPPRIIFFLGLHYPAAAMDDFLGSFAKKFSTDYPGHSTTILPVSLPFDTAVMDMLAPLYEDPTSALQTSDLIRAGWDKPIRPGLRSHMTPAQLSNYFLADTPTSTVSALFEKAAQSLLPGNPSLSLLVPDAPPYLLNHVRTYNFFPRDVCLVLTFNQHTRPSADLPTINISFSGQLNENTFTHPDTKFSLIQP